MVRPAAAAASFPSGYQQLKVDNDGLCVDVFGGSTANDAAIDQWGCKSSGQSNQAFRFNPVSGGYGELQNQNSGLDINVSGASTANLAPVIQWTQDGAANALWLPIQLSDGHVADREHQAAVGILQPERGSARGQPSAARTDDGNERDPQPPPPSGSG